VGVALAAAAGRVDDEGRRVEASRPAPDVPLDPERGGHRRAQVDAAAAQSVRTLVNDVVS
jgi:hypothetical protein